MTRPVGEQPPTRPDTPPPEPQTTDGPHPWSHSDTLPQESGPKATASETAVNFPDYELRQEIARGGMGVVYHAWQRSLQRPVALKMILEGKLASESAVLRFHQEARAAAGLDHPHIVPIYAVGEHDGRHYFTMALVDGPSLSAVVHKDGLPSVDRAAAVVLAVAEAVAYAHDRGIVHRDLKPDNVLVDSRGRPRVTDFGLAKSFTGDSGLTASGEVLGTPSYMAPEQALGETQKIGPPADVYALGGILYFLLTGKPPFTGKSAVEVLYRVVHEAPVPPRKLNPAVPAELEAVCLKCLAKDPAGRYAMAAEVAAALRPWAGGELITPSRSSSVVAAPAVPSRAGGDSRTEVVPARPRRRLGVAAVAVVLAGLLAAVGYLAWRPKGPHAEETPEGTKQPLPVTSQRKGTKQPLLPVISHHDFGLKVEMTGATPDKEGGLTVAEGQTLKFRIETARNAYVGVWNIDADGIRQIFPNKYELDNEFKTGRPRVVPGLFDPGKGKGPGAGPRKEYAMRVTFTGEVDRIWVVASTEEWEMPEGGEEEGPYRLFRDPNLQRKLLVVPVAHGKVAEKLLSYRVTPRPGRGK